MVDALPLRIVYFGTPSFAVPTLERLLASHHQVLAVITQPDRPRGRGQKTTEGPVKALALRAGLPVLQPERLRDDALLQRVAGFAPDLGVVAAYGKILPEPLLMLPRHGTINVHASLLPKYRGAAPVHRAVMAGETMTGVTIMRIVTALDAGATFASITRPIGPDETSDLVEHDLAILGAALLVEVADRIAAGIAAETPQDAALATYAARLEKGEGLLDWSLAAADLHNRVRGLHPWPLAYTFLGDHRLIVRRTAAGLAPGVPADPGTVIEASAHRWQVATGFGGALTLIEVQPEGKRPMSAREYLAGRPVRPGTRLGHPGASTA